MPEEKTRLATQDDQASKGDMGSTPGEGLEGRVSELRVSASMMRLDPGLYCLVLSPSPTADAQTGLPGVRVTPAPGPAGRPDCVEVRTVAADGWLSGFGDAALVRISDSPAYVMVTIYLAPGTSTEGAPNLQVLPLIAGAVGAPAPGPSSTGTPALGAPGAAPAATGAASPRLPIDIIAHVQTRGDVGAVFGEWLGERGSGKWVEGFGVAPTNGVDLADIEYQVVLGRGWLSPWVEGGQFCGSRGMALPMLGMRIRLRGAAVKDFELRYTASFVDGTVIGPVGSGEACEAESLSPLEAMLIELAPRQAVGAASKPAAETKAAAGRSKPRPAGRAR